MRTVNKTVSYLWHGQEKKIVYDKLIISTGSSQLTQKISSSDGESVLKYKRPPKKL